MRSHYHKKNTAFYLLFSGLFLSNIACSQISVEKKGPEAFGDLFVTALQSANLAEQEAIVRQVFSEASLINPGVEKLTGLVGRLQQNFTPLEYHHSEVFASEVSPDNVRRVLHIYLRKKGNMMWNDIQVFLDTMPPYKFKSVAFIAEVAEPVSLPNGDIAQKATLAWLSQYIQKLVKENDLSGSAFIARGDKILLEQYFGFADSARTRPVNAQTLFNLGSGNKMFTALAIAHLQEQGKLQFTDKLTTWFPDFPDPDKARKVTLHHLLTHTSGISEYWTPKNLPEMRQCTTWQQLLKIIYQDGFQFEPGTEAGYSNSNFILLGAIIEKVSGQDYFDFIASLIYSRAGMKESGSFEYNLNAKPIAMPLARHEKGGWKEAPHGKKGSPAGGGYSNAQDLFLFAKSLKNNVFVSTQSLKNMVSDKTQGLKDAFPYGYGFIPQKDGGVVSYGHGGITSGVNLEFRYFPDEDITLVIFCNQDNGAFDDLKKNAIKLITGDR